MFGKNNFRNQIGPSLVMFLLIIMFHLMILYFIRNNKNPNPQDLKTSNPLTEQQPATLHDLFRLAKKGFRDPETRLSMKFHPRIPTGFMYGIFTYIWLNFTVNIQYIEPMGYIQQITSCNTLNVCCILLQLSVWTVDLLVSKSTHQLHQLLRGSSQLLSD